MYFNGAIKYKNILSSAYGLIVTEPPKIDHSQIQSEEYVIPGKNGFLYSNDSYRGSAAITVKMELVKPSYESGYTSASYQNTLRNIWKWLQGTGNLELGDVSDSYYEVQRVEITSDQRVLVNYGKIEAKFTVYPYEFMKVGRIDGTTIDANTTASLNIETDTCEPLYFVNGVGNIQVNGNTMEILQNGRYYIDVRRSKAYFTQGEPPTNVDADYRVNGDYKGLVLKNGSNTITTSSGISLRIIYSREGYII